MSKCTENDSALPEPASKERLLIKTPFIVLNVTCWCLSNYLSMFPPSGVSQFNKWMTEKKESAFRSELI